MGRNIQDTTGMSSACCYQEVQALCDGKIGSWRLLIRIRGVYPVDVWLQRKRERIFCQVNRH